MIEAAYNKKMRAKKLREDETTSIVFGPLQHIPANEVFYIFCSLLGSGFDWATANPTKAELRFWPNLSPAGRVKPDLLVHFSDAVGPVASVLVEVKWDHHLTPPCELVTQWRHLKRTSVHAMDRCAHLSVVKNLSNGERCPL